jgi:glycosyltransferase involved in cell wall biosynthesis
VKSVALFVDRFPVLSETFVVNEARALLHLGHELTVEARRRGDGAPPSSPPGPPVHYVSDESRSDRVRALAWLAATHPVRAAADALQRLRRAKPDRGAPTRRLAVRARRVARMGPVHVHTHFAFGIADDAYRIARLLNVPSSLTAHALDIYVYRQHLRDRLIRSDFVTSGCDYTVAELKRVMGTEHGDRAFRQVMGIDAEAFRRSTPLPATRHVAAVGRLVEKKGFVYLVRAAAQLTDVSISIAGEGPERETLEAEIARLGVASRVTLLGAADPEGVRGLLETADVFCMPCVVAENGDRDSMPVVVKEAMAMELCVVGTDEVGLPEIVRPPFGALVPPRDPEALAHAIERMLALDPGARQEAGAAARRFVTEHADITEETRKLSGWIESAGV